MPYSHKTLSAEETEGFVIESLQLSNSTYRKIDGGLIEAFVPVKRPPSFFGIEQPPFDRLLMAFGDDPRGLPAEAELVSPGSYRLNWFIDGLRSRGRLCQAYVPFTLPLSKIQKQVRALWPHRLEDLYLGRFSNNHELYLLATFKSSLKSDESKEYIDSAAINLVNGSIEYSLPECLAAWPVKDCVHAPAGPEPEIPVEQAFQQLIDAVLARAETEYGNWRAEPQSRFAAELERLEAYYDDHGTSGSRSRSNMAAATTAAITANKEDALERRHLVAELREKFRPRLIIRWLSAAFLYLPIVHFQYEAISAGNVRQGQLRYEPVTGVIVEMA